MYLKTVQNRNGVFLFRSPFGETPVRDRARGNDAVRAQEDLFTQLLGIP